MFHIVWEFTVPHENVYDFEQIYWAEGEWARLFRHAPEFQGTTLLRDFSEPGRYLTVDIWSNARAYENFRLKFANEYRLLDERCERLTTTERLIGRFENADAHISCLLPAKAVAVSCTSGSGPDSEV